MDYQAIVLGGGPAGARSAELLAAGGLSVLLLEAEGADVDNLCSGLLNAEGQAQLGCALPEHVRSAPAEPMLEFHDCDNRLRLRYAPGYWNMRRPAFDAWLRERAELAGATVRYHSRASRIELTDGGVRVHVNGDAISAQVVVDATGWRALSRRKPPSLVAAAASRRNLVPLDSVPVEDGDRLSPSQIPVVRANGHPPTKAPHVHAFQGVVESDMPADSMWAVFQTAATPYYGWLVPKGAGRFLLGAGFFPGESGSADAGPWGKLEYLIDYIRTCGYSVTLVDDKPLGCPITTIGATRQLWWGVPGVFPVGEAAGLVSPSSGDGIHFCLAHARALADVLLGSGGILPLSNQRLEGAATHGGTGAAPDHAVLTAAIQQHLKRDLSELRFNCVKARVAALPPLRGLAARLLPLYLRRPVQRLAFG